MLTALISEILWCLRWWCLPLERICIHQAPRSVQDYCKPIHVSKDILSHPGEMIGVTNSQGQDFSFLYSLGTVQHPRILFSYSLLGVGVRVRINLLLVHSQPEEVVLWDPNFMGGEVSYDTLHLGQNLDFNFWTCGPWEDIKNKNQVFLVGRCPQRPKQHQCSVFPLDSHFHLDFGLINLYYLIFFMLFRLLKSLHIF